jgi:hypothetical protein
MNKLKQILLFLFSVLSTMIAVAQGLSQSQVDVLKQSGQLPKGFSSTNPNAANRITPPVYPPNEVQSGAICNCLIPLDSTFSIGQFDYEGGSGGPGQPPEYRNDDWSTAAIALPFTFCYFGQSINSIYINNNGNISFNNTYSIFTADSFPDSTVMMIAPFWADVDTRGAGSGLVYYKVTATHVIVKWNGVGYYGIHDDLLNNFQLIITDGNDSLVPNGNTAFCYGDMQWTTGDASNGVGGFGGFAATVGANLGDGSNFIQFGRFDQTGYAYDGPFGASDGVDWLDSANFIFDLCPANVPPIPLDCSADSVFMRVGDTINIDIYFLSPEMGQVTTLNVNSGALNNLTTLSNTSGDYAHYSGQLIADAANLGYNSLSVTATDNGLPPATTVVNRVINIDTQTGMNNLSASSFLLFPNPCSDEASLQFKSSVDVSLVITNIIGKEVYRKDCHPGMITIDKEKIGRGVFFYSFLDKSGRRETGKLILY